MALSGSGTSLVILSCLCSLVAMILHIVAFSTHNWVVSVKPSPFSRMGFHRACFDECRYPYCPGGDQFVYDGCWWIFDIYFREIKNWLLPSWFIKVRNMVIINVPLTAVCFFLMLGAAAVVCFWRYPRRKTPCRNILLHFLLITSALLLFASAMLAVVGLCQIYMNAYDYGWMPMPEKNALGSSYWMEVAAAIMLISGFASALLATIFKMVGQQTPKDLQLAEDMMLGGAEMRS